MTAHRATVTTGGATRILIIDDDRRAAGTEPDPSLTANSGDQLPDDPHSPSDGLPVVHEYQVPTPVPAEGIASDPAPDASVVRELLARVEELLHRTRRLPAGASTGWSGTIRFGSVLLQPATHTVLRGGQPVRVTHTEFRLLLALMRRRGAIASRVELLREVWGAGAAVSRRAVDTHIARLRRKLEDDPANPRHILTALAWGYRFRP